MPEPPPVSTRRLRLSSSRPLIFVFTALVSLAGCRQSGPHIAPVSGTVMLDGQPVYEARLIFQPEAVGSPSYGFTDQQGHYQLGYKRGIAGALVGWHKISVKMDSEIVGPDGQLISRPQAIPERYNENSELRREVLPGKRNVFDFELTSEPASRVSSRGA